MELTAVGKLESSHEFFQTLLRQDARKHSGSALDTEVASGLTRQVFEVRTVVVALLCAPE